MTDHSKRRGLDIERVWITAEQLEANLIFRGPRPTQCREAFEYMRVMSRDEVEKLAGDGVDPQQLINSLMRTVEGQRREINRLMGLMPEHDTRESYRCTECSSFHLRPSPEKAAEEAARVEAQLAEDRRLFGNAFWRVINGRKVRIPPEEMCMDIGNSERWVARR